MPRLSTAQSRLTLRRAMAAGIVAVAALLSGTAGAQTVSQDTLLSFGTFALRNNNAAHELRVQRTGAVNADSAYAIMIQPQYAEFGLSGFPGDTQLTFLFTDATLSLGGMGVGTSFTVTNFTPPASVTTDPSGNATLRFGASLFTSGDSQLYADGSYSGTTTLTINY